MDANSDSPEIDLRIVLVNSIYERNIGAASRAMSNMGVEKLILIAPQCEITFDAQQAAATGQDALQNRIVYSSWDEFFQSEPRGYMIATTTKDGRSRQVQDLDKILEQIKASLFGDQPKGQGSSKNPSSGSVPVIHLVFGREDWGLSSKDIENAHFSCAIPTYGVNASLNLAQAVLLALYIFRTVFGGVRTKLEGQQKPKDLQKKPVGVFPDQSLKLWLQEMGFKIDNKKVNVYTTLKRMMLQNVPSTKEFRVLEIVLQQSIRKLREYNEMRDKKERTPQDS